MISVVVSTRNRPEMVIRCVRSIVAAATKDLTELIVVDQSTGPRADLEKVVGPKSARTFGFTHIATDTVGLSRSRNIGIAASCGELVAATDDDCVVEPDWVAAIAAAFKKSPDLTVLCGRVMPMGEAPPGMFPVSVRTSATFAVLPRSADPSKFGSGNNLVFKRDALEAVGGYDERLGAGTPVPSADDSELLYRFMHAGAYMVYDPAPTVQHESWRGSEETLKLAWNYAIGSAVYLTREVVGRGDTVALKILAGRTLRWVWLLAGAVALGKPGQRRTALRHLSGIGQGIWAVLTKNPRFGITREWIHRQPKGPS